MDISSNNTIIQNDMSNNINVLGEENLNQLTTPANSIQSNGLPRVGTVSQRIRTFQPDNNSIVSQPEQQLPIPPIIRGHNMANIFSDVSEDNSVSSLPQNPTPQNTVKTTEKKHNGEDKFNIFKNEYISIRSNNIHILKESKECKRLLDLKYNDLVSTINNIQTSVIFTSTISGFLQATKLQFSMSDVAVSVVSITIATYISLVLSISKYYALDELKERIQLLREKYSLLLNEIDYNMDKLGPWSKKEIWTYENHDNKYSEWKIIKDDINGRYNEIVNTKKELVTEYECIMDTKSRNYYHIQNKKLNLENKQKIYEWEKKEVELETTIAIDKKNTQLKAKNEQLNLRRDSIMLATEELDNWSFDADEWNSV